MVYVVVQFHKYDAFYLFIELLNHMQPKLTFDIQATSNYARTGVITLNGVSLATPVFMPVGTKGTLK